MTSAPNPVELDDIRINWTKTKHKTINQHQTKFVSTKNHTIACKLPREPSDI